MLIRGFVMSVLPIMFVAPGIRAEVPPAKPYGTLVTEVMAFLQSDVGTDGIRTNDNDPGGYPVPPYFYHYAIRDGNGLWSSLEGYPGYRSISYPAYTACVAIDAFLDWRRWSGCDDRGRGVSAGVYLIQGRSSGTIVNTRTLWRD